MGCLETVSGLNRGDIRGLKICRHRDNIARSAEIQMTLNCRVAICRDMDNIELQGGNLHRCRWRMGCLETVSGRNRGDIRGLKICRDTDNVELHPLMQVANGVLGNCVWAQQGRHQGLEDLQR